MNKPSIENDGADVFVTFNGVRIAKRGKPDTPQARMWVSAQIVLAVARGYPAWSFRLTEIGWQKAA